MGLGLQSWATLERVELLLAHEGGWDEALMVLVPLVFLAGLLRLAHVRASRLDDAFDENAPTSEPDEA